MNNLAIVVEDLNDRREARALLTRAILLFRQAGERRAEGRAFVNRARLQLQLGASTAALVDAQRGLALVRTSADRLAEADAIEQLGRAYTALRNPTELIPSSGRASAMSLRMFWSAKARSVFAVLRL